MKLLILGGTQFVGWHIADCALKHGHQVSLFHRGQTGQQTHPQAEHLLGDRDRQLSALRNCTWDAVIDVSGYHPRIVSQTLTLLRHAVPFYTFVSTISVYADFSAPHQTEDAPTQTPANTGSEEISSETYGPNKAHCEQLVRETYGDHALIIRPGIVAGPRDPTDRFTYWPVRAAHGQTLLAPGSPGQRIQYIDARDLAEWTVRLTEQYHHGTLNAVIDDPSLTFGALIRESIALANPTTKAVWMPEQDILAQGIVPFTDLPLWLPTETTDEYRGFATFSNARARSLGLTNRPLRTTLADTLHWAQSAGRTLPLKAGLSSQREAEALASFNS